MKKVLLMFAVLPWLHSIGNQPMVPYVPPSFAPGNLECDDKLCDIFTAVEQSFQQLVGGWAMAFKNDLASALGLFGNSNQGNRGLYSCGLPIRLNSVLQ